MVKNRTASLPQSEFYNGTTVAGSFSRAGSFIFCLFTSPLRLHSEGQPTSARHPHFYLSARHGSEGEEGRRDAVPLQELPQQRQVITVSDALGRFHVLQSITAVTRLSLRLQSAQRELGDGERGPEADEPIGGAAPDSRVLHLH